MSDRSLTFRLLLAALGAAVGLVLWAVAGIGMVELGLTGRFDPFGVAQAPPPATPLVRVLEWSFPVFAILGAWLTPAAIAWLIVNPNDPRR
jgi:hypothetical protein